MLAGSARLHKEPDVSPPPRRAFEVPLIYDRPDFEEAYNIAMIKQSVITTRDVDVIEAPGAIVVDIPLNLEVGRGIRADIARLHGGFEKMFQKRAPGAAVKINSTYLEQPKTIYYVMARTTEVGDFDLQAYEDALISVRQDAKKTLY